MKVSTKFCDRCGKVLPPDVENAFYEFTKSYELVVFGIPVYNKYDEKEIDLCRKCSDSLARWFKDVRGTEND